MRAEALQRAGRLRIGTSQYGEWLVTLINRDGGQAFEISRAMDNEKLWTTPFEESAPYIVTCTPRDRFALARPLDSRAAKEIVESDPKLEAQKEALTDDDGTLLQVFATSSGETLINLVLSEPVWNVESLAWGKDLVAISERALTGERRAAVYDIVTGAKSGRFFGASPLLTPGGERLILETDRSQATVYDTRTLRVGRELAFSSPIISKSLGADSTALLVLTADQKLHRIDLTSPN